MIKKPKKKTFAGTGTSSRFARNPADVKKGIDASKTTYSQKTGRESSLNIHGKQTPVHYAKNKTGTVSQKLGKAPVKEVSKPNVLTQKLKNPLYQKDQQSKVSPVVPAPAIVNKDIIKPELITPDLVSTEQQTETVPAPPNFARDVAIGTAVGAGAIAGSTVALSAGVGATVTSSVLAPVINTKVSRALGNAGTGKLVAQTGKSIGKVAVNTKTIRQTTSFLTKVMTKTQVISTTDLGTGKVTTQMIRTGRSLSPNLLLGGVGVIAIGAVQLLREALGTYPFAGFLKEEAIQTIDFPINDGIKNAESVEDMQIVREHMDVKATILTPDSRGSIIGSVPHQNIINSLNGYFTATARSSISQEANFKKKMDEILFVNEAKAANMSLEEYAKTLDNETFLLPNDKSSSYRPRSKFR